MQEVCTSFIKDFYKELNDDDLFGLLCLEDSELHNIKLEEVKKNRATKLQLLEDLNDKKNLGVKYRRGLSLAQALNVAIESSKAVPTCHVTKRGHKFINPSKWVVAFLGSQRPLSYQLNLTSFDEDLKTNLLIVCITNEPANIDNVHCAQNKCSKTNQGGFMIIRYHLSDRGS